MTYDACVCVRTPPGRARYIEPPKSKPPDGDVCEKTHTQRSGESCVLFVLLLLYFTSRVVSKMEGFASTLLANSEVANAGS